jgi:integrase
MFLAYTGLRISEALDTTWDDIDLEAGVMRPPGTKTKTSTNPITVPPALVDLLKDWKRRQAEDWQTRIHGKATYIFPAPTKPTARWNTNNYNQVRREVFRRHGFGWVTTHTWRRSLATTLQDLGVPLTQTQAYLRHADPKTTMSYVKARLDDGTSARTMEGIWYDPSGRTAGR